MPLSVTELMARLRRAVEAEVGEQCVVGEIGSCKVAGSGHIYFTLKDATAQLQCVLYRFQAAQCPVRLREGMQAELAGRATVWEGRGSLQFVVSSVKEAGQGSLQQQFEALKRRLEAEGLFSPARKKPLPAFPRSVGLITSATGAVIQDMRHRLQERAPWMKVYLLPVQVQGHGAESGIARAIAMWNEPQTYGLPEVDYLIVARGGGSLEDLWCFNEETLARTIAASRLPLVSAVGHETDFTIADFVADLRAPTPTAAIELTTPDAGTLLQRMERMEAGFRRSLAQCVSTAKLRLRLLEQGVLGNPAESLAPLAQRLDDAEDILSSVPSERLRLAAGRLELCRAKLSPRALQQTLQQVRLRAETSGQRLTVAVGSRLAVLRSQVETLGVALRAASPQHALARGFALVRDADGRLARNSADFSPGDRLRISLAQGELIARVAESGETE